MKKQALTLALLLALSIIIPMFTTSSFAYNVTQNPSTSPKVIEWISGTVGWNNYLTLLWNPEFLVAHPVGASTTSDTTLYIDGKDAFGKDIEASAFIPAGSGVQFPFIFNDTNVSPQMPVAFTQITKIFQSNGTDNEKFRISTQPWPDTVTVAPTSITLTPYPVYLGEIDAGHAYMPTDYYAVGVNQPYKTQDVAIEPPNPEPLKIIVNWADGQGTTPTPDLIPQTDEINPGTNSAPVTVTIEGLDMYGNKIQKIINIPAYASGQPFIVDTCAFSTVCKVFTTGPDSYYIFTNPLASKDLFYYYLLIDHVTIHPDCYDILANPSAVDATPAPTYPGVINVTVALRDIDGNLIRAANYGTVNGIYQQIIVNFYSSGGKIQPSTGLYINPGDMIARANLTADTNPRTVNVTADVNVPACPLGYHPELDLPVWTQMTFDGVNSANDYVWGRDWPIDTLLWGYTDAGKTSYILNAPAEPWLPPELGGPNSTWIKLDGPIYEVTIPLYVGCNLISSPVHPILCTQYYTGYPSSIPTVGGIPAQTITSTNGIPMDLLFKNNPDCIEAIWSYDAGETSASSNEYPTIGGTWTVYVPGVSDAGAYFTDGVGYWIKAEKPCTLEISGTLMENGPFTPPTYELEANKWNLVGVTSVTGIKTSDYLNSVSGGTSALMAAGPVWEYNNPRMTNIPATLAGWQRNPDMLWPTQAFWVYNKVTADQYIAP